MTEKSNKFEALATKIGKIVDKKNAAYGDSFAQAGTFLKLLYPNGIAPEKYGDMLAVVRIFDKLKRIASQKDAFDEDPFSDIVGYGLLGIMNNKQDEVQDEVKKEYVNHVEREDGLPPVLQELLKGSPSKANPTPKYSEWEVNYVARKAGAMKIDFSNLSEKEKEIVLEKFREQWRRKCEKLSLKVSEDGKESARPVKDFLIEHPMRFEERIKDGTLKVDLDMTPAECEWAKHWIGKLSKEKA